MKFEQGQVLQFKYNGQIFGKIIQAYNLITFKKKGPTHSAIIYNVNKDVIQVAESTEKGFLIGDYDKNWLENVIKEGTVEVYQSKIKLTDIKKNIEKYIKRPYGFLDILAIGTSTLFRWVPYVSKKLKGDRFLICSEAVVRVLYDSSNKEVDFEKEYGISFDMVAPIHISNSQFMEKI